MLLRFLESESGATAIEYALLAGLLGVAIIAAVSDLGSKLRTVFNTIASVLDGVT